MNSATSHSSGTSYRSLALPNVCSAGILILLILAGQPALGAGAPELHVEGRIQYHHKASVEAAQPISFSIDVSGCSWLMRIECDDPLSIFRKMEVGCDGSNVYSYARLLASGHPGGGAAVLPGPAPQFPPPYFDQAINILWLAYCSGCLITNGTDHLPALIPKTPLSGSRGSLSNPNDRLPVKHSLVGSAIGPGQLDYIDPSIPSQAFTNLTYRVTSWLTNHVDSAVLIPGSFEVTVRALVQASDGRFTPKATATFGGETLSVANSDGPLESPYPKLPGTRIKMTDRRFQHTQGFMNPVIYETDRWLADREVEATPEFKHELGIETELNRAHTLQRRWGPRAAAMLVLLVLIAAVPVIILAWQRAEKS
jgi:hypothetical protein